MKSQEMVFFIKSLNSNDEDCKKERKKLFNLTEEENSRYVVGDLEEDSETYFYMMPYMYAKKIDKLILEGTLKERVFTAFYGEDGITELKPYEINKGKFLNIFKKFKDIKSLNTVLGDEIAKNIPQGFSTVLIGQQMGMVGASQNISNSINSNKEKFEGSQKKLDDIKRNLEQKEKYEKYKQLIDEYNSNDVKLNKEINEIKEKYDLSKEEYIKDEIEKYKTIVEERFDNENHQNLSAEINATIKQNEKEQEKKYDELNQLEDKLVSDITEKLRETNDFPDEVINIYTDSYKLYRQKNLLLTEIEKLTGIHIEKEMNETESETQSEETQSEEIQSGTQSEETQSEELFNDETGYLNEFSKNDENDMDEETDLLDSEEGQIVDFNDELDESILDFFTEEKDEEDEKDNAEPKKEEITESEREDKNEVKKFNFSKKKKIMLGVTLATLALTGAGVMTFNVLTNKPTEVKTKTSTETSVSYLLSDEEYEDYLNRLSQIDGIYLNSDGSLGGSLYFSDGTTRRIKEFTKDGEIVLRGDGDLNETKYSKASVDGLLARLESGTKNSETTNEEQENKNDK